MKNLEIKRSKTRKIVSIGLFILLIIFAIVQLNDPDPMLWFSIYVFIAILTLVSNYKRIPRWFLWSVFGLLLIYSIPYSPYLVDWLQTDNKEELFGEMVYEKPYLEGTREFFGLIISAAVVAYLLRK